MTALAAALALAACEDDPVQPQPTPEPEATTAAPEETAGLQEIDYGELLLRVPEQWQVHELSYTVDAPPDGREVSDDWLLLQTDPSQTCDFSAGEAPGIDYGCAHVMILGPGSIEIGHGLGQLTEDHPFALGTNPGPCPEGIDASLPEPSELGSPEVASEATLGDSTVPYREWRLACMDDPAGMELSYHLQRTWYLLPQVLIVDNWETEGLTDHLAGSELR